MDKSQMKRLAKACKRISDGFIAASCGVLETAAKVAKAENDLAVVANYDLVHALRPVAREISAMFMQPNSDTYVDIFDQASRMILEGKDIPDVLYHFDTMLYDLKHGRK